MNPDRRALHTPTCGSFGTRPGCTFVISARGSDRRRLSRICAATARCRCLDRAAGGAGRAVHQIPARPLTYERHSNHPGIPPSHTSSGTFRRLALDRRFESLAQVEASPPLTALLPNVQVDVLPDAGYALLGQIPRIAAFLA